MGWSDIVLQTAYRYCKLCKLNTKHSIRYRKHDDIENTVCQVCGFEIRRLRGYGHHVPHNKP